MDTRLSSLQLLQKAQQPAGSSNHKATAQPVGKEDYATLLARLQKEQSEWEDTLQQFDFARYKISLQDGFWNSGRKTQDYLTSTLRRQQREANQQAIAGLLQDISTLQRLQQQAAASGQLDTEAATALGQKLDAAAQATLLLGMMNMGSGTFGTDWQSALDGLLK